MVSAYKYSTMGCTASTTKTNERAYVADFDRQVNVEKHPVAIALKNEWLHFVSACQQTESELSATARAEAFSALKEELEDVWANSSSNPVSHSSVDGVGRLFLFYVRNHIIELDWGGNFDYKVVGTVNQGFIVVSAEVDVSTNDNGPPIIKKWTKKIHYYGFPPPPKK